MPNKKTLCPCWMMTLVCLFLSAKVPLAKADFVSPAVPGNVVSPTKFALLVGINDYPQPYDLRGCVPDATEMKTALKSFGFTSTTMLLNKQASRAAIVKELGNLVAKVKVNPNAQLLFYFSGHGTRLPDLNGDEKARRGADGWDQALCPSDYGVDTGANAIIDDDIDDFYQRASAYTKNIAFIFDSCHSGTGTRGPNKMFGAIKEIPNPKDMSRLKKNLLKVGSKGGVKPLMYVPRVGNWALLAGCSDSEQSLDYTFSGKPHGMLTYYLLQAMRGATNRTTYGAIWQEVSRAVGSKASNQHPVLEGAGNAEFLGGSLRSVIPPFRYKVQNGEVILFCGNSKGARPGGYARLFGVDGAAPVRVQITACAADMSKAVAPPGIAASGQAMLLTPYFGIEPLKIVLSPSIPLGVSQKLKQDASNPNNPVDVYKVVNVATENTLTIHYDFHPQINKEKGKTRKKVYFILQGQRVLYNNCFPASSNVATLLEEALEKYAQSLNLRSLNNASTKYSDLLDVQVIQVPGSIRTIDDQEYWAEDQRGKRKVLPQLNGRVTIPLRQGFQLALKNKTRSRLFVAVAVISADGAITLLRNSKDSDSASIEFGPTEIEGTTHVVFTTPPLGVDVYKILVSKQQTDWFWVEREGIRTKGKSTGKGSPFEVLLKRVVGIRGIGRSDYRGLDFDSWAAGEIEFNLIQPKKLPVRKTSHPEF